MSRQIISAEGVFTHGSRMAANQNFLELYALNAAALGNPLANNWFVDGDSGNDNTAAVNDAAKPFATIQAAVTAAQGQDRIFIAPRAIAAGSTDPSDYAETIIVPAGKSGLQLIGVGGGPAQGAQPQIKKGSGSTALLTVRSPGCVISGITFNGASSTGGGILLDDDGVTKTAFGTVITGCMFKNCKGHATNGKLGGAIAWAATGSAWQVLIGGNRFYSNVSAICLIGTSQDRPKDIVVTGNHFGADAATAVDTYIYGAGGSGFNDIVVSDNTFETVLPNNTSGLIHRYMDLTGVASGIVCGNFFGGASGTYGAAGNAALIPTTVGIAFNYQDGALIGRT